MAEILMILAKKCPVCETVFPRTAAHFYPMKNSFSKKCKTCHNKARNSFKRTPPPKKVRLNLYDKLTDIQKSKGGEMLRKGSPPNVVARELDINVKILYNHKHRFLKVPG